MSSVQLSSAVCVSQRAAGSGRQRMRCRAMLSAKVTDPGSVEEVARQAQSAVGRALSEGKSRQLLQLLPPVDQRQFSYVDTEPRTSGERHGSCLRQHRSNQNLLPGVCCSQDGVISQTSSMSREPKWKQKLAAADDHAERTRQKTLLVQEEYKQKQAAVQRLKADTSKEVFPLRDLEFLPYLKDDGLITDCTEPNSKASVYAIFDSQKVLQYVGVSRQVSSSMRLHFARMPSKCYYVKIQNISKPSRSLLELIREKWFEENGARPNGNDNGPEQNAWENPLDCKFLMTEEEKEKLEEAGAGPPKAKVLKNVARRVEAQLEKSFRARNCKERLRFDPKLKERGLLDLKNL